MTHDTRVTLLFVLMSSLSYFIHQIMHEIIPNLWLGDCHDAHDIVQLTAHNIKTIINCTNDIEMVQGTCIACWRFGVDDIDDEKEHMKLLEFLSDIMGIICDAHEINQPVLVHCKMGRQRSACVVAAYLMWGEDMSKETAIAIIKTKKRDAFFPEVNFDDTLSMFEKNLEPIP